MLVTAISGSKLKLMNIIFNSQRETLKNWKNRISRTIPWRYLILEIIDLK